MKLKHQALSAVSATALLIAASVGLVSLGSTTTLADPISPAAQQAITAALNSGSMQTAIAQMNSQSPGSGDQFVAAFNATDTDSLASALATLAESNSALQTTIDSALSTLSSDPSLASVAGVNVANLVSTVNTTMTADISTAGQTGGSGNSGGNNSNGNGGGQQQANNGDNGVNPAAGPNPNGGSNVNNFTTPFTSNPNNSPGQGPSTNTGTPGTPSNNTPPTNQGKPNSRA